MYDVLQSFSVQYDFGGQGIFIYGILEIEHFP